MIELTATEHMSHKDSKKYLGEWVSEDDYDVVYSVDEDVVVYKPGKDINGRQRVLGAIKKNHFGEEQTHIKELILSLKEVSNTRANCAGPIDVEQLEKDNGWKEGVDFKLRTKNSYYTRNKKGDWSMIATGNNITNIMAGYKRGRFTGKIGISGWCKSNPKEWEIVRQISPYNGSAYKAICPEHYEEQEKFITESVLPEHRIEGSIMTTISINRYDSEYPRMSYHIDAGDLEEGLTTMCIFKDSDTDGNYLVFPRYRIAVKRDDGDVVIGDSGEVHGVTPMIGDGVTVHTICYCDTRLATIGDRGKPEKLIGRYAEKVGQSTLEGFFG